MLQSMHTGLGEGDGDGDGLGEGEGRGEGEGDTGPGDGGGGDGEPPGDGEGESSGMNAHPATRRQQSELVSHLGPAVCMLCRHSEDQKLRSGGGLSTWYVAPHQPQGGCSH